MEDVALDNLLCMLGFGIDEACYANIGLLACMHVGTHASHRARLPLDPFALQASFRASQESVHARSVAASFRTVASIHARFRVVILTH